MKRIIKTSLIALALATSSCSFYKSGNFSLSETWVGEPDSGFRKLKTVSGKKYMVASASELSSQAGAEILARGGNAIDAAIATQLVLNVVEPHSSGIGGGGFLLYFDNVTGKTAFFDGRETAPALAHEKMFLDEDGDPREFFDAVKGGLSVGTPGTLKAMRIAHNTFGQLPWEELFEPAIKIANDGFEVSERFHLLSKEISYLKDFKQTAGIYLDENGEALKKGDIIRNPQLAKTFEKIAHFGTDIFYKGSIAQDIADAVSQSKINPGYLRKSDLENYKIRTGGLLCSWYRGKYKICSMDLPSGGSTLLQMMGILENFNLKKYGLNSTEFTHLVVEATRLAYADRNKYVADIKDVPLRKMLSKRYLKKRAALISLDKKIENIEPGQFGAQQFAVKENDIEPPSTTHISIIDDRGNSVSMTSSIEYFFGSAISVDGFLLNNQLTDFSFSPEKDGVKVANRVAPLKRPRSSMSPTFVFDKEGKLLMSLGSPGGPRIIQSVAKTIIGHLDFGMDIQKAISAPSFVVLNDVVELEENQAIEQLKSPLKKLGHRVKILPIVSGINAAVIKNDKLQGGSDPRREGFAIGR